MSVLYQCKASQGLAKKETLALGFAVLLGLLEHIGHAR